MRPASSSRRGARDEIGIAERELAAMQNELADMLRRRAGSPRSASRSARSATICATCCRARSSSPTGSSRSTIPTVQRLVPKLIASLDRAIRLCARTLDYGQAQEPRRGASASRSRRLIAEIGDSLRSARVPRPHRLESSRSTRRLDVDADRDQLYRVLTNLVPQRRAGAGGRGRERRSARASAWSPARKARWSITRVR